MADENRLYRTIGFYDPTLGYWEGLVPVGSKDEDLLKDVAARHPEVKIIEPKTQENTEFDGKKWVFKETPDSFYSTAIDDLHNKVAIARGYESRHTIATYANSAVDEWKKEAEDFLAWRDQTTLRLIETLNIKKDRPTLPDFLKSLPKAPWKIDK